MKANSSSTSPSEAVADLSWAAPVEAPVKKRWGVAGRSLLWLGSIVLLLEGVLNFTLDGEFTRNARLRMADMATTPAPVIEVYGDSVADSGINVRVLEQGLGVPAGSVENYAVSGSTAFWTSYLLRRQLNAGRVPKVIILAYNARSYNAVRSEKFLGRVASIEEILHAPTQGVPLSEEIYGIAGRCFFTLRYRQEISTIIHTGTGWEYFDARRTPAETMVERRQELPTQAPEVKPNPNAVAYVPAMYGGPFRPAPEIDASLREFFELAKEHHIRVWLICMPMTEETEKIHQDSGFNLGYHQFLDRLVHEHSVDILTPYDESLPAEGFVDGVHLSRASAFHFSERLHDALAKAVHKAGLDFPAK